MSEATSDHFVSQPGAMPFLAGAWHMESRMPCVHAGCCFGNDNSIPAVRSVSHGRWQPLFSM